MKMITAFITTLLFTVFAFAGFQGYNSTTNLGLFSAVKCSTGLTCSKVGEKLNIVTTGSGTLQSTSSATTVSITSTQCGRTFNLASPSSSTRMGLPTATSSIVGCRLTFVTGFASNFLVNPDDGDQILVLTNASGDMISNTTLGNTVTLQAAAVSQWVVIGEKGTWADAN